MPIFDQGYQHWDGVTGGRLRRQFAIVRQGLRVQAKNKFVRRVMLAAWSPALVLVTSLVMWGLFEQGIESVVPFMQGFLPKGVASDPSAFRPAIWTILFTTFFNAELYLIMLLVAIAGPNLISGDLRMNAMPLYLSRPLTRFDYFVGKLGVIASLVASVAIAPAVMAYVTGVFFSSDWSVVKETWQILAYGSLYGLVIVLSAGTLMLAISSFSHKSLYVGIAWLGLWLGGTAVSSVLDGVQRYSIRHLPTPPVQGEDWEGRNQRLLAEAAETDWRPLCSYVWNIRRIGDELLGARAAWQEVGKAIEVPTNIIQPMMRGGRPGRGVNPAKQLVQMSTQSYPWKWSAGVLLGLFALSVLVLNSRIKTLDRL